MPTDLAAEMRHWPEFVSGDGYTVHLRDAGTGVEVSVQMVERDDDFPTVIVEGVSRSPLFDRTVGRVIQALSEHSDDLQVDLVTKGEQDAPANAG
jgi:hypothetical protein